MYLEPNDLLLFARIVEEGSFVRAARRIGVPTSTVSRRMNALEGHIGERLVHRSTRKIVVTEVGETVLQIARQIAEGADAVAALAEDRQVRSGGRLRLSAPLDMTVLGPFLADFMLAHPSIVVEVDVSIRVVDIVEERYDVALWYGQALDDSNLFARRIVDVRAGLYASPTYLSRVQIPAHPAALGEHLLLHVVGRSGQPLPWILERGDETWSGSPPARAIVNSPDLLLRMAIQGAGITIADERAVQPYVSLGQLTRVLPEWSQPSTSLWAIFPARKLMPARTRAFLDTLVAALDVDASAVHRR